MPTLLEQYADLSVSLSGFTLGFYKFFDSFACKTHDNGFQLHWNSVQFASGTKHIYPDGTFTWWLTYPLYVVRYCSEVQDLIKFIEFQKDWIRSADAQRELKRNRRIFREECQRRINFFVTALHGVFSGLSTGNGNKTFDPYLRDIRNMAFLALKE